MHIGKPKPYDPVRPGNVLVSVLTRLPHLVARTPTSNGARKLRLVSMNNGDIWDADPEEVRSAIKRGELYHAPMAYVDGLDAMAYTESDPED